MCGRFAGLYADIDLARRFQAENKIAPETLQNRYNIAPSQHIPTVTRNSPNKIRLMRWGLIPSWSKSLVSPFSMINLRGETLGEKPYFKRLLLSQRCLIPSSGFYEWQKTQQGFKQPFFIRLKKQTMFSFAGLYDVWKDIQGKETVSCAIITTSPNKLMEPIHNRMPVIFNEQDENTWLDPDLKDATNLLSMLLPYQNEKEMEAYPISKEINNPANEGKDLIKPI